MKLDIYVDGSFNDYTKTYGSGVVVLVEGSNEPVVYKEGGNITDLARMRNIAGEILAASYAVNIAEAVEATEVTIYYDLRGVEEWYSGKQNATKPYTKAYRDKMRNFSKKCVLNFVKLEGHSGNKYHDMADRLAKEACGNA